MTKIKNFLNKTKYLYLFIGIFLITIPVFASLKEGFGGDNKSNLGQFANSANYSGEEDPAIFIGRLLTAFFSVLGIIAIALIIYSGFTWMTARGNEAKVSKAKDTLIEVIIGLLFIIGSYALTMFLLKIFT